MSRRFWGVELLSRFKYTPRGSSLFRSQWKRLGGIQWTTVLCVARGSEQGFTQVAIYGDKFGRDNPLWLSINFRAKHLLTVRNVVRKIWSALEPANLIIRPNRDRPSRNACEVKGMVVDWILSGSFTRLGQHNLKIVLRCGEFRLQTGRRLPDMVHTGGCF